MRLMIKNEHMLLLVVIVAIAVKMFYWIEF